MNRLFLETLNDYLSFIINSTLHSTEEEESNAPILLQKSKHQADPSITKYLIYGESDVIASSDR